MPDETAPDDVDFGPRGYLPGRAAKRARKIVLRAPMGLQWVVAAIVLGGVVLVAGWLLLTGSGDPPPPPFVPVEVTVDAGEAQVLAAHDALLTTVGRPRAFADAAALGLAWCAPLRQVESDDGRVWSATGRGFDGVDSLALHPTSVYDGVLYLDPTRTVPGPPPTDEPAADTCA